MKAFGYTASTLLAALLISCAPGGQQEKPPAAGPSPAADLAGINKLRDDFAAAFNAGDAARVTDLYTADAIILPQNSPAVTGKDAILSYEQDFFGKFAANISIAAEETKIAGEWAFDRGTYKMQLTPKGGGKPAEDSGKYLVMLQRQADGSWKVARDIDNSSNPPPAPPK